MPSPDSWGAVECPACGRKVPTFRLAEHRETCETKEERNARALCRVCGMIHDGPGACP